jgi:hypothetical protein
MEGSGRHYRIEEETMRMLRNWIREEIWFGSNGSPALLCVEVLKIPRRQDVEMISSWWRVNRDA